MQYRFLIDTNLPIDTEDEEVSSALREYDVAVEGSTDLPTIGRKVAAHEPDIAFIPSADYHRSIRKGDRHYGGLVIPTSKFTGMTDLPSVLVVRRDDPAESLKDLEGATYGYINKSCTSSYFPPAVMLAAEGIQFDRFLAMRPVKPWQGQIDAVVDGEIRSTMVPEDVWRTTSGNAETTKVIDRYDVASPASSCTASRSSRASRFALRLSTASRLSSCRDSRPPPSSRSTHSWRRSFAPAPAWQRKPRAPSRRASRFA